MMKQEHRTSEGDRVRIKDTVTHLYPQARVYNEGVVRARMHDRLGYPLIYIEWDADHWAYSGEPDRWALEAHFDLVEDMSEKDPKDFMEALFKLVSQFKDSNPDFDPAEVVKSDDPRPDREYSFDEVLSMAGDDARESEAFIIIVAKKESLNGERMIIPNVFTHYKREDAALLLEATMADLAAQAHNRAAIRIIRESGDGASS